MKIDVVLVRTEHSSNIGATVRALANMNVDRLILIDPKCEIDSKARQMAAGAADRLSQRVIYPSWAEFFANEGEGLRIALSRRRGRKRKVFGLSGKLKELAQTSPQQIYLIFGPEADGLSAEDLAFVNYCCYLPVYGEFASYNLAQAVLLALFIVRQQFDSDPKPKPAPVDKTVIPQPFYFPDQLIKDWLEAMGFDVSARKASAYLTLRRLFLQNLPTKHEIQVLEAVLQQNLRKLKGNDFLFPAKQLADDRRDVTSE